MRNKKDVRVIGLKISEVLKKAPNDICKFDLVAFDLARNTDLEVQENSSSTPGFSPKLDKQTKTIASVLLKLCQNICGRSQTIGDEVSLSRF